MAKVYGVAVHEGGDPVSSLPLDNALWWESEEAAKDWLAVDVWKNHGRTDFEFRWLDVSKGVETNFQVAWARYARLPEGEVAFLFEVAIGEGIHNAYQRTALGIASELQKLIGRLRTLGHEPGPGEPTLDNLTDACGQVALLMDDLFPDARG